MKKLLLFLALPALALAQPSSGVTQIKAGDGVTISPTSGKGIVTINSTGSGSGNVTNNASLTSGALTQGNGTTGIGPSIVTANATTITVGAAGVGNIIANVITSNNQTTGTINATTVNATNITGLTANRIVITNSAGNITVAGAGTSGGVPYFGANGVPASSAALTVNNIVIGGGAGAPPTPTSTAAGILTFIATPSGANLAAALTTDIPGTALADTAVTPGSYTNTSLTVDQQGRITAASSGAAGGSNNAALFSSTADAVNDHVASDTSVIGTGVGSKTTSANYFAAGTILIIDVTGYISTALTPDTLNVKIKAGSTSVGATGAITVTGSLANSVWRVLAIVTCRTAGASGTFIVNTIFESTGAALVPIEGKILNTSTVTLDTTGTLVWDVTAVWGSTTAGDVITGTNALLFSPGNGAVVDPGANGFMDRTALNTTAARTLTGTANQIGVTNGGGGGNPVFSLVSSAVLPGSPTVGGTASTAAGGVVTIDGTQTLTAKTFVAPALGTPASGVATNLTGTAASLTAGTASAVAASGITAGTLTANITLGENLGFIYDAALSADGKYSGIVRAGTAGATLAFGNLVYLAAADSRWELTDADSATTSGNVLIGMCVLAAAADGDPTTILLTGFIRADAAFPTLTIGAPAYISPTAGAIVVAAPSTTGQIVRRVGFAWTADELYFNPSMDSGVSP